MRNFSIDPSQANPQKKRNDWIDPPVSEIPEMLAGVLENLCVPGGGKNLFDYFRRMAIPENIAFSSDGLFDDDRHNNRKQDSRNERQQSSRRLPGPDEGGQRHYAATSNSEEKTFVLRPCGASCEKSRKSDKSDAL